jgi:hypothetical protein
VRILLVGPSLTAVALLTACGGSSDSEPSISGPSALGTLADAVTPAATGTPDRRQGGADRPTVRLPAPALVIEIKAGNAAFDKAELKAPARSPISVILQNDDKNISHNFSLYRAPNGEGPVFIGDLVRGEETRVYAFTTPEPGLYYFRDDLMPGLLHGTLEVN